MGQLGLAVSEEEADAVRAEIRAVGGPAAPVLVLRERDVQPAGRRDRLVVQRRTRPVLCRVGELEVALAVRGLPWCGCLRRRARAELLAITRRGRRGQARLAERDEVGVRRRSPEVVSEDERSALGSGRLRDEHGGRSCTEGTERQRGGHRGRTPPSRAPPYRVGVPWCSSFRHHASLLP
jgi:hypothetical protein